jgi:hypothetical protein
MSTLVRVGLATIAVAIDTALRVRARLVSASTRISEIARSGAESGRVWLYSLRMTMRNFLIALVLTGLFLGILLLAGTTQNQGCFPWQEPVTVGGSGGVFSEDRGETVCR